MYNINMELTTKQEIALSIMQKGENVFITGCGGTGKTELIKTFYSLERYNRKIALTSTTGTSATLIGGTTLHSYLGIGFGKTDVETMSMKILDSKWFTKKWKRLDALIIDEVSMLSDELFSKLENVARVVRNRDDVFGGIQIILCGDFLQLPCIKNKFCFESQVWDQVVSNVVHLTEIIRQDNVEFQTCLNNIRWGICDEETRNTLLSCVNRKFPSEIEPTRLHSTNDSVDAVNEMKLDELAEMGNEFYEYTMTYAVSPSVRNGDVVIQKFNKGSISTEVLQICIGAQVMLIHNLCFESGLVNGSRGVVIGFVDNLPKVRFMNGIEQVIEKHTWDYEEMDEKILKATQIPLKVSFAISIHKCQGSTLDCAEIDLSNVFEYGQAYVALSRVKGLDGLSIVGENWENITAHPSAIEYYNKIE